LSQAGTTNIKKKQLKPQWAKWGSHKENGKKVWEKKKSLVGGKAVNSGGKQAGGPEAGRISTQTLGERNA